MVQNNHMYIPAKWQKMSSGVGEFMAKCPLRGYPIGGRGVADGQFGSEISKQ